MKHILLTLALVLFLASHSSAQEAVTVPMNNTSLNTNNATVTYETYMGKESMLLETGYVFTKDIDLQDGTIEVDINFPEARFFPSFLFRVHDENNYESFYVRPHQSGNPDATQYTPIFNGFAGWQLYHGQGYGTAVVLEPDTWHHIRINILGDEADIFFDDMETPLIKVTDLKHDTRSGGMGFSAGVPVHFAGLKYSKKKPTLVEREPSDDKLPEGLITSYQVSNVVSDADFRDKPVINTKNLRWTKRVTESSGTINLAKFSIAEEGRATVLAKFTVKADEASIRQLVFGYSDFVWVYVNGVLMYGGENTFMSRDYRYLGTIGFFDAVYAHLKKGENEILFVIGENFGGWGVKAAFTDMEGIEIE